jgi:hypothetical protein
MDVESNESRWHATVARLGFCSALVATTSLSPTAIDVAIQRRECDNR